MPSDSEQRRKNELFRKAVCDSLRVGDARCPVGFVDRLQCSSIFGA